MELFNFSSNNNEILCIDKFIGDNNCNLLCEKILSIDSIYSNVNNLILRGNCLGPRGAQSISRMLYSNQTIHNLSLEWNQIGSEGCIYLANSLTKNNVLQTIDLRNNNISNEGAIELANSLVNNFNVIKLDLRWNHIGDEGANAFEKVFRNRTTQFTIYLAGNPISNSVMEKIEQWNSGTIKKVEPPPPQPPPAPIIIEKHIPPPVDYELRLRELKKENDQLLVQLKDSLGQCADLNRQVHISALRITELEQIQLRQTHWLTQVEENLRQAKIKIANQTSEYEMATSLWQREREEMQEKYASELSETFALLKSSTEECDSLKERLRKTKELYDQLSQQQERLITQHQKELSQVQEELRLSQIRCSELQVLEAQATARAQSEAASLERMKTKLSTVEDELEVIKNQCLMAMETERNRCTTEIERMRIQFNEKMAESHERENLLTNEISELQTKVSDGFLALAASELKIKQSAEEAAKEAREIEKTRGDRIAENLKQRLEVAETSLKSIQERSVEIESEAKDIQSKLTIQINGLQTELHMFQNEIGSLRNEKKALQNTIDSLDQSNKRNMKENDQLKQKINECHDKMTDLQMQLQKAIIEGNKWKDLCNAKEEEIKALAAKNAEEFRLLSSRITEAIARELTR